MHGTDPTGLTRGTQSLDFDITYFYPIIVTPYLYGLSGEAPLADMQKLLFFTQARFQPK